MTKRQKQRARGKVKAQVQVVQPIKSTYVPKRDVFAERVIWLADLMETAFTKVVHN
jgi:hypothetical protein